MNIEKATRCLLPFSVGLAFSQGALADAFRCGSQTVQEGMTSEAIRERCGEPDLIRTSEEPVFSRLENGAMVQVGVAVTDFWYYDRGPAQFVVQLAVRDSIAEEIEILTIRDIESLPKE